MGNKLVIIGGGIVGIAIARELSFSSQFSQISVIEKETHLGMHSSTRNSGVIHAGFYYDPNSFRGRFCSEANKIMRDYCRRNEIPVNRCGKVVVAKNEDEGLILRELYQRGLANGAKLELLNAEYLHKIEPLAKTFKKFLWSPNTWSASPKHLLNSLVRECKDRGVEFIFNFEVCVIKEESIASKKGGIIPFDFLINAAGGYSLKLAHRAGLDTDYAILPFKGLYLKSKRKSKSFARHIYPVPSLKQTFLGVHTTLTFDNFLKLGPTAIPVISPENYSLFQGITFGDFMEVLPLHISLFFQNTFGFRDLAWRELKYLAKTQILNSANSLLNAKLTPEDFDWYSPGIRAQLFDKSNKTLVSDFVVKETDNSIHLLNCISPAWTCCFKTSRFISERVSQKLTRLK
ncbi:NAD(P)/FAD-dependent oxidoreductase [Synechococcus sp. MIT S1220]|uniref:NAD(P)/FAD-dependent oxidoreductase n=1 Tax=Synechococcus sp. MIT S1220 TaxID=3082549 RepID=UPI0039B0F829